jgi:DoxX-like family
MQKEKIIYWVSTSIVAVMMLFSSFMYLSKNEQVMEGIKATGIPYYFMVILGVAKLLGAIALLYPKLVLLKEWAYAGFTFTFIGAVCTHIATGTAFVGPLVFLVILAVSYWFRTAALTKS